MRDHVAAEVTVRYFAGARAVTGVDEERVDLPDGVPVGVLAEELARRHGDALGRVLAVATFLVDEVASPPGRPVPSGAVVDVLPPFAGG